MRRKARKTQGVLMKDKMVWNIKNKGAGEQL